MSTQFSGDNEFYPARGAVAPNLYTRILSSHTSYSIGQSQIIAPGNVNAFLVPISVPFECTIDLLGYVVGNVVGGNARLGLHDLGSLGFPDLPDGGALVVETAADAVPVANQRIHWITVAPTQIDAGLYFGVLQLSDNASTWYEMARTQVWHSTATGGVNIGTLYAHAFGAFTDPCPVTVTTVRTPFFLIRVASVP